MPSCFVGSLLLTVCSSFISPSLLSFPSCPSRLPQVKTLSFPRTAPVGEVLSLLRGETDRIGSISTTVVTGTTLQSVCLSNLCISSICVSLQSVYLFNLCISSPTLLCFPCNGRAVIVCVSWFRAGYYRISSKYGFGEYDKWISIFMSMRFKVHRNIPQSHSFSLPLNPSHPSLIPLPDPSFAPMLFLSYSSFISLSSSHSSSFSSIPLIPLTSP